MRCTRFRSRWINAGADSLFALRANVRPEISEKPDVLNEFIFAAAFRRGAHDETTGQTVAVFIDDSLQTRPFFIGCDLARNADVIDGRHVDEISSREARCAR